MKIDEAFGQILPPLPINRYLFTDPKRMIRSPRDYGKNNSLHMRRSLPLLLGTSALFFLTAALAGPRDYLFRNERLCDTDQVFCFRGTLSYHSNPRLLRLRARVQTAPGPGLLRIRLAGTNQQGHRRFAPFEVRVRGHYSEIINHKMIPDYPDVQGWVIEQVDFIADEDH